MTILAHRQEGHNSGDADEQPHDQEDHLAFAATQVVE
jgi:hypothetical protein